MLTRAVIAFVALPGVVAFAVPLLLAWPFGRETAFAWIGAVPLALGAAVLLWSARNFLVRGKGTLAPWDPPRHLVTTGPYGHSRNPMYVGVALVLFGWAIGFRSWRHLVYALAALAAFHVRVVWYEEPWLARTYREAWARYTARVPRWIFPTRRALVAAVLALLAALPIAGLIFEAIADAAGARAFPPPGMLVDVGGRRLHLLCIGAGEPTVLFESSGWGSAISSPQARERIGNRTTVCSYDRRGKGWSDPAPGRATAGSLAQDLAVLQDRAGLRSPLVIVTSSIGGLTTEMFARRYPERVGGLVFLDAASSLALPMIASRARAVTAAACTAGAASHFGLVRLLDPFDMADQGEDGRRGAAITYNTRSWGHMCAMARGFPETVHEFEQAPPLDPQLPLSVLSASSSAELAPPGAARFIDVEGLRAELAEGHAQLAHQSNAGKWMMVPDSTHLIASSQPDAVVDAVLEIVDAIR